LSSEQRKLHQAILIANQHTSNDHRLFAVVGCNAAYLFCESSHPASSGHPDLVINAIDAMADTGAEPSIARTIVDAHDGQVSASNEPGRYVCSGSDYRFPAALPLGSVRSGWMRI
jgi:hypothetical protein